MVLLGGSVTKNSPVKQETWVDPLVVKKREEGNDTPLQYSCLGNPMDRGPGGLQSMGSQELDTA